MKTHGAREQVDIGTDEADTKVATEYKESNEGHDRIPEAPCAALTLYITLRIRICFAGVCRACFGMVGKRGGHLQHFLSFALLIASPKDLYYGLGSRERRYGALDAT